MDFQGQALKWNLTTLDKIGKLLGPAPGHWHQCSLPNVWVTGACVRPHPLERQRLRGATRAVIPWLGQPVF